MEPITIALVGCGAAKRQGTHKARDLYTSQLFQKSLRYAEARAPGQTFIVSAKHGLLDLDHLVASYEARLAKRDADWWAVTVVEQLERRLWVPGRPVHLIILAGERYAEPLRARAAACGWTVEEPLRGLGIGKRLGFLSRPGGPC